MRSPMEVVRFIVVAVVFVLIAYLYRSLPQNLNALSLRYARLSPRFRASLGARLQGELAAYRAVLTDPSAFQSQALHLQALIILSAAMTLLAAALFIASQLAQPRAPAAIAAYFPPADALIGLFFLFSLVGLRLAVFRSWMFLHRERNLRRLERTIAALGGPAPGSSKP